MVIEESKNDKTEEKKPELTDQIVVTRHRARIGGKQLAYTVTCGTMVIREEAEKEGKSEGDKARAKVFFIAYTLDDVKDRAKRPLTLAGIELGLAAPGRARTATRGARRRGLRPRPARAVGRQ